MSSRKSFAEKQMSRMEREKQLKEEALERKKEQIARKRKEFLIAIDNVLQQNNVNMELWNDAIGCAYAEHVARPGSNPTKWVLNRYNLTLKYYDRILKGDLRKCAITSSIQDVKRLTPTEFNNIKNHFNKVLKDFEKRVGKEIYRDLEYTDLRDYSSSLQPIKEEASSLAGTLRNTLSVGKQKIRKRVSFSR